MKDLETENLLYKYFSSDVTVSTENLCSFEFEPVVFTAAGEIKTLSFITKLSGSVNVIVSNPGSGSGKYTVNIYDDEGKNLIENSTVKTDETKNFELVVSSFHKYTIKINCYSVGSMDKEVNCRFSARIVPKTEAYVIKC